MEVILAFSTVGLFFATVALAIYTYKLVDINKTPLVIVSIVPSPFSSGFDLEIENKGTATAYSIEYETIPQYEINSLPSKSPLPFRKISVLKPDQKLEGFIGNYEDLKNKEFHILVKWFRDPEKKKPDSIQYTMSTFNTESFPRTSPNSQLLKKSESIAKSLEKIEKSISILVKKSAD